MNKLFSLKGAAYVVTTLLAVTLMAPVPLTLLASSHREAPLIAADPKADATDLYAFVSPDRPDTVTLIANYHPFQEPAGGPNFYTFDDNILYEIKVDSDGDAVEDVIYQFRFTTTIANPNTFLYNTGAIDSLTSPNLNVKQTYTLTQIKGSVSTELGNNIPVPPSNIGPKSTPNYGSLQAQAVKDLSNGIKVFAGQSEDPFFVELGGLFDLLTIRNLPGNMGGGVDGLKGYNVNALALQIPITQLTKDGSKPTDSTSPGAVIGVWTTASRQSTRVLSGGTQSQSGAWVQVSRLGAPLVNEVVVPLGAKDIWNGSKPADDAQFANGVTDPELGKLLNALYNVKVPPQGAFGSANQRDDLISVFLTGIPQLTKSSVAKPSEQLRLNVAVPPAANPKSMGVLAGDNAGYPNGRRLADDVTDISIRAVAGAVYPIFHSGFSPDPLAAQLGDGVDGNDASFRSSFPYLALPYAGYDSIAHGNIQNPVVLGRAVPFYRLFHAQLNDHFYTANAQERDSAVSAGYVMEGSIGNIYADQATGSMPLYRFYNSRTGQHFYSANALERDNVLKGEYRYEGVAGYVGVAEGPNLIPVYRLSNTKYNGHLFTANANERDSAVRNGYAAEGTGWFAP